LLLFKKGTYQQQRYHQSTSTHRRHSLPRQRTEPQKTKTQTFPSFFFFFFFSSIRFFQIFFDVINFFGFASEWRWRLKIARIDSWERLKFVDIDFERSRNINKFQRIEVRNDEEKNDERQKKKTRERRFFLFLFSLFCFRKKNNNRTLHITHSHYFSTAKQEN
jgi:hypothetical protein